MYICTIIKSWLEESNLNKRTEMVGLSMCVLKLMCLIVFGTALFEHNRRKITICRNTGRSNYSYLNAVICCPKQTNTWRACSYVSSFSLLTCQGERSHSRSPALVPHVINFSPLLPSPHDTPSTPNPSLAPSTC